MSYNTQLQTINTDLQSILDTVNNLTADNGLNNVRETWELTMNDGSVKSNTVKVVTDKVYRIIYDLGKYITSSNTGTFIKEGATFKTVLSSGDSSCYYLFKNIESYIDDGTASPGNKFLFSPEVDTPWLTYVSIPNVTGDVYILGSVDENGFIVDGDWE